MRKKMLYFVLFAWRPQKSNLSLLDLFLRQIHSLRMCFEIINKIVKIPEDYISITKPGLIKKLLAAVFKGQKKEIQMML